MRFKEPIHNAVNAEPDDVAFEDLLTDLSLFLVRSGRTGSGRREWASLAEAVLEVSTSPHAEALRAYLARQAALEPAVHAFRETVLGGLLTETNARAFLRSPHNSQLSLRQLRQQGISPLNRSADDGRDLGWELIIPAGGAPGSVLAQLEEIGKQLAAAYGWDYVEAVWFVLTGAAPHIFPVNGGIRRVPIRPHPIIWLEVETWVPVEPIAEALRGVQTRLLGKHYHPPAERNLKVFQFVMNRSFPAGLKLKRPSWSALMAEWNRKHSRERYRDRAQFARDFRRGEAALDIPEATRPQGPDTRRDNL